MKRASLVCKYSLVSITNQKKTTNTITIIRIGTSVTTIIPLSVNSKREREKEIV